MRARAKAAAAAIAVMALGGVLALAAIPRALFMLIGGALVSVTANAIHAVVAADSDVPGVLAAAVAAAPLQADSRRERLDPRAQVGDVNVALGVARDGDDFHAGHDGAGGVRAVRGGGNQTDVAMRFVA